MALEVVGVDEVERLLVGLATDIKESGYNPEVIIGMTRKGLYPALRLAIMLGVPGDRLGTLAAIKGADGRYHVTDLTRVNVAGLRVLAVDDFSVSNRLLPSVADQLRTEGAADVRTCVMAAVMPGPDFVGRIGPVRPWYFERITRQERSS
jgi:hypoxanthine phosphoribosyltransferase